MAVASTLAAAATIGDPTQPQVIEAPPTFGSCQPPISTVGSVHTTSEGTSFTLSNSSGTKAHDALTFDVLANGQRRYFWVPVDLRPGVTASVSVRFLTVIDSIGIKTCGDYPRGIIDGDTPILQVSVIAPPDGP